MPVTHILHIMLLSPLPVDLGALEDKVVILLIGGGSALLLSYLFTFAVRWLCRKMGWLDQPSEDRVHKWPTPRLGGVAIFLAFVIASLVFYISDPELQSKEIVIYWLFLVAATLIVLVHAYDDVKGLKPLPKLIAQTAAVLIILGPFGTMFHGVLFYGFSNPFGPHIPDPNSLPWYLKSELTLFIHSTDFIRDNQFVWAVIPAVVFTWFWMVAMMNMVNWIDGMDGLATGVVGITGLFITIISWILGQHTIALLSAIFTGAVLGFLPHNWNPAKIFMGDSGSQFLGLGLAVLSVIGGAKIALLLMVMGIPILDMALVILNRVRRGQSPMHRDKTHLQHRFLATGLTVRQICYVLYTLITMFGILALSMEHQWKLLGLALVGVTMAALVLWMDYLQRRRGVPVSPDPEPEPTGDTLRTPTQKDDEHGEVPATPPPPDSPGEHVHARLPL
ncbi:MAG TPA: MraY family glycosyltransferase [Ktedonosporobacter sp.]|nr:MraY family glycosyltransferase [Ktedonosporobacter sp.]